jgi:hypothetical protein
MRSKFEKTCLIVSAIILYACGGGGGTGGPTGVTIPSSIDTLSSVVVGVRNSIASTSTASVVVQN